ncbi:PaaI family thioesterase [Niveispirillum sp.]|uniref:PaaI family thioesterase n=1 Tax=Niveispirillum sp. TaxID=1917217 RepID=UPI001B699759|nr:PaaI family thioesterase [Niveispirillum sp.]MBP7334967.1 PaaI family thioesterase [Niveispirillum sp.]
METHETLRAAGWQPEEWADYAGLVGPFWRRREGESVAYGILCETKHRNEQGTIHGGMIATLADHGIGLIVWDSVDRRPCATIQMNMQFIGACRVGDFIVARGEILRAGRSVIYARGMLTVGDRSVAGVDGVWKLLEK